MNSTETTTSQTQLIAEARLENSPLNARRAVRPDEIVGLKASILPDDARPFLKGIRA